MWSNIAKKNKDKVVIKKVEKKKIKKKKNDTSIDFYDTEFEFSFKYDKKIIDIIEDFEKMIFVNNLSFRFRDSLVNYTLYDFIKFNSFEYIDVDNEVQKLNNEYNNDNEEQYSDDEYYE